MKHAKCVIKTVPDDRPVLKGVKHLENGSLVITDGIRLYLLEKAHERKDGAVITPDGRELDGNYPKVERLFSAREPIDEVTIQLKEVLTAVDIIYSVGNSVEKEPEMVFIENFLTFDSEELKIKYDLSEKFEVQARFKARIWLDALRLIQDLGFTETIVQFYGLGRPIVLFNESLKVLLMPLPLRRNKK